MRKVTVRHGRVGRRDAFQRRLAWTGLITIFTLIFSLFPQVAGLPVPTASAHNLNASAVYVYFDPDTQTYLDGLITGGQRVIGTDPLLQPGDELGLIIKAMPDEGTTTGVGGYVTFYIPDGLQVLDAAYIMPGDLNADGITGYDKVPMKGQAQMPAVGAGGGPTVSLVGITRGPNILGVTSPIVTAANANLGTLPGVYGDTGIFYSTAPETAFGTYSGGKITNNSGDEVGLRTVLNTTLNKWDAWQMAGYGIAGTTNPAYPSAALIDSNQRGYAPWGLANVVAGPQSGYAWEFDFAKYSTCDATPTGTPLANCIDQATQDIGPWQRIKYPGSQFADDPPGANPPVQPYTRGADASNSGFDLTAGDLPQTTGQANGTPNAVRWAYGQQTQYRPEYMWIKVKVHNPTAILDATGCPKWTVDTFGGDAGGDSGGKDHIWRYYDPNSVTLNGCLAIGKPATRELVKVGDTYQYKVKLYNAGNNNFSTVQIKDTLPAGVTYISAVPAPSSVSLPNLTWTVAPFLKSQMFEATVTVKASGSGLLTNNVCAIGITTPGGQTINSCGQDVTVSGNQPLLRQSKSVTPTAVAPGGTVAYTINVLNVGSGPTGSPVVITEYLPTGFTYVGAIPGSIPATVNGASVSATVGGTAAQPTFTVPAAIQAGKGLALTFNALVSASITAANYCNSYRVSENGINQVTGSQACVDVGGGAIGDTVYRDWNGNGIQDPEDEGLPGMTVNLYAGACPPSGGVIQTQTTSASGFYQFIGLTAGNYCVDPVGPAGYTLTQGTDPTSVTLAQNEKRLNVDYGYRPVGNGSIGDIVFDDQGNDGVFNGADVGIPNVTVKLYEDSNGNGVIDTGDALIGTTQTNGSGVYGFTGLAEGLSYIVDVDQTDPDIATYFGGGVIQQSTADPQSVQGLTGAYTAADFGFYKVVPGAIGDQVFYDLDADGVFDSGESGLANVDVKLYQDTNGNGVLDAGEPLLATTTTDAAGVYSFNNLPAGTYVVDVVETDPDIPDSLAASRDPIAVTLGVAQVKTDVDFPFVQALTKSVDKATAQANDQLLYTIYPRYFGEKLLTGVVINDTIPAGTTYVAGSIAPGAPVGEAVDADEIPDGIIDYVAWDLGSNDVGSTGYSGGTAMCPATSPVTVYADADTWLSQNKPTMNYGIDNALETSNKNNDFRVGLLHFNIGAGTLPAGSQFWKATLKLMPSGNAATNRNIEIRELLTAWNEGAQTNAVCGSPSNGATWEDPNCAVTGDWQTSGGQFGATDYGATNLGSVVPANNGTQVSTQSAALNTLVTSWLGGGTNRGVAMLAVGSDDAAVTWYTRSETTAARKPQIDIYYLTPTASGCSGTISLADVADTYMQQDKPNDFFGTTNLMKAFPATGKKMHDLLRFDVDGIPPGATLNAATLKMTVKTAKSGVTSEIHRMTTAWTEGTSATNGATWGDSDGSGGAGDWAAATFGTGDYNATVVGSITPSTSGVKTADVKTLVQGWQNGTFANNGLVLLSTGASTKNIAEYYSREDNSNPSKDPVIDVTWSIPPADPTRINTMSASPLLVVEGDKITVKMVLQNTTASAVTNVAPSSLTVTASGNGTYSCATLTGPSPASQTVPANGSATFTWTCTTSTAPTLPGNLTFSATASGDAGATTWASSKSESVIVTPALTFKSQVNNPPGVPVATNQADMTLAFPSTQGTVCYVMADGFNTDDVDYLRQVDRTTGAVTPATPTAAGTQSIEAMTWSLDYTTLYAANANQFGTLNPTTGLFTAKAATIAIPSSDRLQGEFGDINNADVDGLSFDPATGVLYGVHRREGTNTQLDVLIKIDPVTGKHINNAFGTGVDYIKIRTDLLPTPLYEVDDISFDPVSGQLFAIANGTSTNFSVGDRLVTINKATGAVTDIARITKSTGGDLDDVEGLSFYGDGALFATTGYHAATGDTNKLWYVDKDTAIATERAVLGTQTTYNDYEAVACKGGSLSSSDTPSNEVETALTASIGDRVWADLDGDGVQDAGEPGLAGVEVCATPAGGGATVCHVTDAFGDYRIYGLTNAASYNVTVTPATFPAGYAPTTATTLTRTATLAGVNDADFGLRPPGTASIGDTVWLDANNNGSLDGAEQGLPNVTVKLYIDQNNNGSIDGGDTLIQTTTTDANGLYQFTGLHPDDYLVQVDTASSVTSPYDGTTTIAAAMAPTTGTTNPRDVTITTAGQAITDADFGYNWTGSIGDYVWWDDNLDGLPNESPTRAIAGATVLLYFDADGNGLIEGSEWSAIRFMNTNASGAYLFDNLPPGNYLVDVYEDSFTVGGDREAIPTTPDVRAVTLAPAQDVLTADFGYYKGALVEGNVFHDEDRNGIFDAAEAGLSPVQVILVGADNFGNPVTATTTTDANGHFSFLVPEGTYTLTYSGLNIQAIDPTLDDTTTPTSFTFTAEAGPDWHPSFDFGVDNSGKIGDTVYRDASGNGVQDGGEPGLAGVTLNLYLDADGNPATTGDQTYLGSDVTDALGKYEFLGLPDTTGPQQYVVKVATGTLPANYAQTGDPDVASPPKCSGGACDNQGLATITGGGTDYTVDFGYQLQNGSGTALQTRTISGLVWNDADGGGDFDAGVESAIQNAKVTVVCGVFEVVTFTGPVGAGLKNWSVDGVPDPSTCTITVDETTLGSAAYVQTFDPDSACPSTGCDSTNTVSVSGADVLFRDFGYQQDLGSISGTVCAATDGDGICQAGETGIAAVPVTLRWAGPDGILGTADDVVTSQNTNASGQYSFTGLQPGLYQVVETNLAGYISVADRDNGNPDNITVSLAVGQVVTGRDFEDTRLASVSGYVFEDLDGDGQRDAGEPPLAGVTVALAGPSGPQTAATNALGYYQFTDLLPGAYTINETDPAGYTSTGDADGPTNGDNTIAVTLAAGEVKTQQNFGDERPGSIAGVVFNDANNNGVQDSGELGIQGVQVCAAAGLCATTAADGTYLIPNVPPGSYTVTETDPAGYVSTTPNTLPATVHSGENVTNVNYGDRPLLANTYSISGTVCVNVDGDGVCDPGEAPLPGVTVKLYNSAGTVIATTTTDAAGKYSFPNLANGSYSVVETDPIGYASVNDADGGTDNTVAVTVAGANVTGRDFVDTPQPGALQGTVYEDLNLNGQRDAGEPGIPGVTVKLNTGATTTTDASGNYQFTNLAPATYTITETDLAGYISTGDVDGANDNTIVATVPAGVTVTGRDFGDVKLGSITGTVWDDLNSNGVQDSGEPGIPGVPVCAAPTGAGVPLCAVTDASGAYTIPNVPPGGYVVTETDPLGYVSTTPNTVGVTVPSGGMATVDYGDVQPNPALGSISGTVCVNVDGDGVCDPNEAPLAGVTVELWLVGGGAPLYSTTTDVNGDYSFPNLPAGSYRVEEVNLPNYTSVNDADGVGNGADAILPIPINGNAVTDRDFIDTPTPGSLSGKVCDDLDRDGVCEAGEAGIDGVTVKLYDSSGALVGTQTTAGGGLYAFPNLPPDTYTVVETDPANYQSTGDVYGANDNLIVATVPAGTAVPGQNFADAREPGAITGTVYSDLNADGNYDPGEPGLANVQVCLAPAVLPCQTTNASGQYAFLNLPPGNYTVTEPTDPAGYVSTGDADGAGNGLNTIAVTVPAGVTVIERNFFDHESAVIGVAKHVTAVVNNGNGTYDVTYEIFVKNMGLVPLSQVQATDNLAATFAGATLFALQSKSATGLAINPAYTGNTPNINLLTGADSLAAGASGTITLVVRVTPGSNLGPYNNQVTGTGTSPAGAKPTDLSQDGTDPDPGAPPDGDPTNNNDPTPVTFTESPVIGVAKRVSLVTDNGDGTQTVTYVLNLENLGNVPLINVQVLDDLTTTFPAPATFSVVSVTPSAGLNQNPGYTGVAPNRGLLLGADSLAVGATGTITLVVKVTPGSNLGPYNNQATASADSQSGGITQDLSDNGTDPDPDGDGNPNETGENDPTPVTFTAKIQIGAAKDLTSVVNHGDGTYDVTYTIVVANLGSTVLSSVQASDNLATTFPAPATFSVVSVATSAGLHKNPGYTGISPNTGLLMGTDTLNPGGVETITLVVRVTPRTNLGPHNNQARATATGPGSVPTADNSDYGLNPDPDGDGNPNENGENDPTPVTFTEAPAIGIAKVVQSQTNNGDGTFTVVYSLNVKNLGDIVLNNVQVTDNLATAFAGATFTVDNVTSGGFAVNFPGYTGSSPNTNLLASGNTLAVGATKTIILTVTVRPAANPATYNNQAIATGVSPAGATATDLSDNGTVIDPDGDKNANEPGENDPTPVTFTQTTGIALVKTGPAASYIGDTITYTYTVTNTGNVALSNVTVSDDKCSPMVGPLPGGDADGDGKLDVAEIWKFTCTYTVLANDPNPLVNHATAQGIPPLGGQPVVSPQVSWSVPLVTFLVGDTVWLDDGDGVQEPGETTGLYNVPITITGTDIHGNPVNFTVYTDINGHYQANFPLPGTYTATAPASFGGYTHSSASSLGFTLTAANPQRLDIDFGYVLPTGVHFLGLQTMPTETSIQLNWQVTPIDGSGLPRFHVWRAVPEGAWKRLTVALLGPVSSAGDVLEYSYVDAAVETGVTYLYRLEMEDGTLIGPWQVKASIARHFFYLPFMRR